MESFAPPFAALLAALAGAGAGVLLTRVIARTPKIIESGERAVGFTTYFRELTLSETPSPHKAAYSLRDILVVVLCAVSAGLCVTTLGLTLTALLASVFAFGLVALAFIDLDEQLLPDVLVAPLFVLGIVYGSVLGDGPVNTVLGAAAGFGVLWAIRKIYGLLAGIDGIGYGDLKLAATIGAWLGLDAIPAVLFLAFAGGTVLMVPLLLAGRIDERTPVPFGPFLAASALGALTVPAMASLPLRLLGGF